MSKKNNGQFGVVNINRMKNNNYISLQNSNINHHVHKSIQMLAQNLIKHLNINLANADFEELLCSIDFNIKVVNDMMMNTIKFTKHEYIVFTQQGNINKYQRKELIKHLEFMHSALCDYEELNNLIEDYAYKFNFNNTQKSILHKEVTEMLHECVLFYLDHYNQRSKFIHKTDFFSDNNYVQLTTYNAILNFKFEDLQYTQYNKNYCSDIINDYKEHVFFFDELLEYIAAAMFSSDRKNAFLWIKAESNWGKSFLLSIFNHLNIAITLSESEIKLAMNNAPLAIHQTDFIRKYILFVEEFKTINSEMKQLENNISIAAKFEQTAIVEVFSKIFFSAEDVSSLLTSSGIEDQFANRFSAIFINKNMINLNERGLFRKIGKAQYMQHICSYTCDQLNHIINTYRKMSKTDAELKASNFLQNFHQKYAIDHQADRLSQSITTIADTFLSYLHQHNLLIEKDNKFYLQAPEKNFSNWLVTQYAENEAKTLSYKAKEILSNISINHTYKTEQMYIDKQKIKALHIKSL